MDALGLRQRVLRRPRGKLAVLISILAWLLLAAAAIGAVARFSTYSTMWTVGLAVFSPYLLLLAVPAILGFVLGRQWIGAGLATCALIMLVVTQVPRYVSADVPEQHRDLVVMTFNMKIGAADANAVVKQVRDGHVDVLMLEELTRLAQLRLASAGLDRLLPHRLDRAASGAAGTGLWSRYPLSEQPFPQLSFNSVVARVAVPGVPVSPTVVALHVAGPVPDATDWGVDLRRLPALLRALPTDAPVVVGGDFNATPSHAQFRRLTDAGYADAASQAGAGPVATYPADSFLPPLIGIDHVLTREAVGRTATTVRLRGSDHRALVVTVAVPTKVLRGA